MAMSTPFAAKRSRTVFVPSPSREAAIEISQKAMSHQFPWSDVMPSKMQEWIEAFALAHNTRPEFVFMGAIMGPNTKVRIRSTL